MSILTKTDLVHGVPQDSQTKMIPMEEIFADEEFNCRGKIAPIDVGNLARQIEEVGLIQPIIIRPYSKGPVKTKYQIVAGYRRFAAHKLIAAKEIKSIIVEGLSDVDAQVINLSENLNREDLNLIQEAQSVAKLLRTGLTQKQIAEKLNKSTGWVQMRVAILKLPAAIKTEIEAGFITTEHIQELTRMNPTEQVEAVKFIKDRKLTEGQRTRVKISKASLKKDKNVKAKRDHKQINIMLDHILDSCGAGFHTRCLAWAAGNITTEELYTDIEKECEDKGITYFIPAQDITV